MYLNHRINNHWSKRQHSIDHVSRTRLVWWPQAATDKPHNGHSLCHRVPQQNELRPLFRLLESCEPKFRYCRPRGTLLIVNCQVAFSANHKYARSSSLSSSLVGLLLPSLLSPMVEASWRRTTCVAWIADVSLSIQNDAMAGGKGFSIKSY